MSSMYKGLGSKLDIDKDRFYEEMKISKKNDKLTDKAVEYFIKIACHGVRHGNLVYTDLRDEEDCIQNALHDMLRYWRNFDDECFKNPFAFFTSYIFNGYAKQFKVIHKHRFLKYTKKFTIVYKKKPTFESVVDEIQNIHYLFCEQYNEKSIKRIQIRYKNGKTSKWQDMIIDEYDFINDICDNHDYIGIFELKYDYTSGVTFFSLNQTGDSEIYSL